MVTYGAVTADQGGKLDFEGFLLVIILSQTNILLAYFVPKSSVDRNDPFIIVTDTNKVWCTITMVFQKCDNSTAMRFPHSTLS